MLQRGALCPAHFSLRRKHPSQQGKEEGAEFVTDELRLFINVMWEVDRACSQSCSSLQARNWLHVL